ncbi:MAG TPA: YdeI/OmpD-associated family protein [Bacteroidia bacterium]|nr:YdeI/OmpD-associated family protein [Bacteroidia bacterium]
MAQDIAQKLKIKEGDLLFTINAPSGFKKNLGTLPAKAKIVPTAKGANSIHWFVLNRTQLEKELNSVLKLVSDGVMLWIYYPKGSSKIQTDLTRDKGWDKLLNHKEMHWISLISFDDTWSTFACRLKNNPDKKKDSNPKEREIFKYIDATKKTVRLPDDLAAALKKNKKQEIIFNALPYSCKKEYVEWIITAKREETRADRVKGTIERLGKGWKNPRNN